MSLSFLKGKRIESIRQHLGRVVTEAIWRSPTVILLDDLDHLVNEASSPEQEMNGEAQYSAHVSQVLQDLLGFDKLCGASIGVIATSQSRTSIHPSLVAASGRHFFQEIIQLDPPTEGQRSIILQCLLTRKTVVVPSCVRDLDLAAVAAKTEGFVARDLEYIVSRAIHANLMAKASVEASPEEGKKRNSEELQLADADFDQALIDYTPTSLRNVPLHQPGEVGWENIGGLTSVKKTLIETLQWPAKYPKLFAACPLRLRSGLLLYGPSGTGKTLLAAAVAKECHLHFIHIKGPELLSKYIGASEQAVRDMFTRAHSARPCALFFDEFDSLAPRRGHDSTGVTDRVVNQLLTQLDGVEGLEGVYVLAATSRPDLIDPALLRPGRLDKLLYCGIPNQEDRFDILRVLTRNLQMAADVDLSALSEMCINFTGADLKALLYNAQLEAIHEMMDIAVPDMMGRVVELADSLDEVSHGRDVNIGAVAAQQPQKQMVVMETCCAHIPALQDGVVEPSGVTIDRLQQEVRHHMTQWSDKLTNPPARKRNVSMAIEIQQKHLLKAASEMVPSVPPSERAKYKMIYDAFVAGKGGNFQHDLMSAGKRATLA
ncbi:Peroxisome biogenesis factor 1 [Lamellibrachia satsuma]|nr:Peroxisome biogenesis factor 1 [Lamellibrachia satsuma]